MKPSVLRAFDVVGGDFVSSLMSMRGLGMLIERVLPLLDERALPGRRGAISVARGASSESSSESDNAGGRGIVEGAAGLD